MFRSVIQAWLPASSAWPDRWVPWRIACSVSRPNQRSTWLIQQEPVGVEVHVEAGAPAPATRSAQPTERRLARQRPPRQRHPDWTVIVFNPLIPDTPVRIRPMAVRHDVDAARAAHRGQRDIGEKSDGGDRVDPFNPVAERVGANTSEAEVDAWRIDADNSGAHASPGHVVNEIHPWVAPCTVECHWRER